VAELRCGKNGANGLVVTANDAAMAVECVSVTLIETNALPLSLAISVINNNSSMIFQAKLAFPTLI